MGVLQKPIMLVIAANFAAVQRRKCKPRPKSKDGQIFCPPNAAETMSLKAQGKDWR
jgi:hypothetical protein